MVNMHLLYDQKIVLSQYLDIVANECVMVLQSIASTITSKCATNIYAREATQLQARKQMPNAKSCRVVVFLRPQTLAKNQSESGRRSVTVRFRFSNLQVLSFQSVIKTGTFCTHFA